MSRALVKLSFCPEEHYVVGELADYNNKILFEYDQNFLKTAFELSPKTLLKRAGVFQITSPEHLKFLPALFHDSLPDSWGMLLMDRFFRSKRIDLKGLTLIDRLLCVGESGVGALTYHPAYKKNESAKNEFLDLYELSNESSKILSGDSIDILPQLFKAGGSPGGARPKIFIGKNNKNEILSGELNLPSGFEHWIVKFNAKNDLPDFGALEYIYSQMAQIAGVEMMPCELLQSSFNERYFSTKRFDRIIKNEKIHVHSFANLIGANFYFPTNDYLDLLKITFEMTHSYDELFKVFRVMIFNLYAHNRDDHAKNFAFLMNKKGEWRFSPAFDLTFSDGPGGEHSMTFFGEGKNPKIDHVLKLADEFKISHKTILEMAEQTQFALCQFSELAKDVELNSKTKKLVLKMLDLS